MYPRRDLNQVADHQAVLRQRIARHRGDLATSVSSLVQPLRWLDRWREHVRHLTPFVPLVIILIGARRRRAQPRPRINRILRWGRYLRFGLRTVQVLAIARAATNRA